MSKNNFLLNQDHADIVGELSSEDAGELLKGLFLYHKTGEEPVLSPSARIVFIVMRKYLDYNEQNWNNKVKQCSEAGKRGMSSRYNKTNP